MITRIMVDTVFVVSIAVGVVDVLLFYVVLDDVVEMLSCISCCC